MKKRGRKYRNLTVRGRVIHYERLVEGKRIRFSTKTTDWDEAAAVRDLWEQAKGIGHGVPILDAPRLDEFAKRYLEEDTSHLASTTRSDRDSYLREDGPLIAQLGKRRLDEITPADLRRWWNEEVIEAGRANKTGKAHLDVLATIYSYAQDLELIDVSPVLAFRATLRRRSRTKSGRSESEAGRNIRPIERPEDITKLVREARAESLVAYVTVLILLDAGLRLGEALGLTWGQIVWGQDQLDRSRSLRVDRSRPRGGETTDTKSGRARTVALSWRLRQALRELHLRTFQPGPDALVLEGVDPGNFRHREWRRILERADIGHRALKDLRDTFASQLLTAGIQLGYVSVQLGHADAQITARHYARWAGGDTYSAPITPREGEVPADVLARLGESRQRGPTKVRAPNPAVKSAQPRAVEGSSRVAAPTNSSVARAR